MRSALPMTTNTNSSRPLTAVAMSPGISITPAKQSFRIGVISRRSSSSSSFKLPNAAAGVVISSSTNLDPNSFRRRGSGGPSSSSALSQLLGRCRCCEECRIPSRGTASCNGGVKALLSSSRSFGRSTLRSRIWNEDHRFRCHHNERLLSFPDKRRLNPVVDFGLKRRRKGNPWVLFPGLNHSGDGGRGGDHIVSPKVSGRSFANSTKVCGLSEKSAGKFGWMELFKPQVMETVAFRFLSDYHTTPVRAVKDSVSPINFFGLGQTKPVAEVVQAGDPVLHEPATEVAVEEIGSARIERIINDMVATMRSAPGVGLAAPQIGVHLQIIVLEDTKELISYSSAEECEAQERYPFDLLVIINPKLKTKSGSGTAIFFEGCLSVNGYRALVERDLDVEVTGLGRDGLPVHVEARGWKARILQHECDHLAGNLYVDKMVSRTFRTKENLRLPLPPGCPKPGICKHSIKN